MWGRCFFACVAEQCLANPGLPTIPAGTYTVAAATGNPTTDTADVMAAINAAKNSSAGGGTVVVPAGTYLCNELTLYNSIDLLLSTGATIQNASPGSTLITNAGTHDMAITGSGTIDGHATTTSSSNLVLITGASNLLVSGDTIANSSHGHLVLEADNTSPSATSTSTTTTRWRKPAAISRTPTDSTIRAVTF